MIFFTSYAPDCGFAPQRPGLGAGKCCSIGAPLSGASIGKVPKQIWLRKRLPAETICKDFRVPTRIQTALMLCYITVKKDFLFAASADA
jgi:hypothetical protein